MKKYAVAAFCMLAFISMLLGGCSSVHEVRVSGTNFTNEISQSQNLIFTFNKDLVSKDALNDWDSTQYIAFEPAVRGKFKWTAPNELVFSPVTGFGAATAYKAKLTEFLISKTDPDKKLNVSKEPVDFHTPYLQLAETESWWTISQESGRQEARLKLIFNYPVNAQHVAEKLKVSLSGKSLDYKILPSTNDHIVTLALPHTGKADNNPASISLTIEKGLKAQNTSYVTQENLTQNANLPSPLHLEITDIKTGFENNTPFVRIITTQELNRESIENGFSINPAVTARRNQRKTVLRSGAISTKPIRMHWLSTKH